jgi:cystathionine beta-lyase/cystathionine gamma-synthase
VSERSGCTAAPQDAHELPRRHGSDHAGAKSEGAATDEPAGACTESRHGNPTDSRARTEGDPRTNAEQEGEHSEAIFPTSSFVFDSAAQAAARFGGQEPGNIYSRFTNPTVRNFEERLAALDWTVWVGDTLRDIDEPADLLHAGSIPGFRVV